MTNKKDTSWKKVAGWYDKTVKEEESYQNKVILPNLSRWFHDLKGKKVIDVGCGQGFFSRLLAEKGATVTGVDSGGSLIQIAKMVRLGSFDKAQDKSPQERNKNIKYVKADAQNLSFAKAGEFDMALCVLSLQNMENLKAVLGEISRVLKPNGRLIAVLNHPAFRIPQNSSWGFDEGNEDTAPQTAQYQNSSEANPPSLKLRKGSPHFESSPQAARYRAEENKIQYRRIDSYLSPAKIKIDMHPSEKIKKVYTYSFHHSIQDYMKALAASSLAIVKLEEWISHRKSETGPRAKAEDIARKEIPAFMAFEAIKLAK
ncbi:MAG: class I SAM-dependent methyltransferase [bacterium]|nr:class I SAM-dependent methyltransferase [bacterium]